MTANIKSNAPTEIKSKKIANKINNIRVSGINKRGLQEPISKVITELGRYLKCVNKIYLEGDYAACYFYKYGQQLLRQAGKYLSLQHIELICNDEMNG